jgi:hypothetical protein
LNAVKSFIGQHEQQPRPEAEINPDNKQTTVRGAGEVLIHTIKLTHN